MITEVVVNGCGNTKVDGSIGFCTVEVSEGAYSGASASMGQDMVADGKISVTCHQNSN